MEQENYEPPTGPLEAPATVVQRLIGKRARPATYCRWATLGIAGVGEERIRLKIWYAGRSPRTTEAAVLEFMAKVTAAKRRKLAKKSSTERDVTNDELRAAGLLDTVTKRAESSDKVSE